METIEAFIDALPKVEIHVHLVGSASVRTVLELARRHPDSPVPTTETEVTAFYKFRDFRHFAEVYDAVDKLVTDPADVAALVTGLARDLAGQNVRYAELTVTPYSFTRRGMPARAVTEALDVAERQSRDEHGVKFGYVFDIASELGGEAAEATLLHALTEPPRALAGFGIGGVEYDRHRHKDAFRDAFRAAKAAGLHSVPHAGEMTGPESIWEAINGMGAERIGHGLNCLRDPRLVAYLRDTQLPLEVCPSSNVCTGQVPDLAEHPLPRLLAEGLFVTLNSDDPGMFGTSLGEEYRRAARVLGLDRGQLATLALNGIRASFLPDADKAALAAQVTAMGNADV